MRIRMAHKIKMDCMMVVFIGGIVLSAAVSSCASFLFIENLIDSDVMSISAWVLKWYNRWMNACALIFLLCGILTPIALLGTSIITPKWLGVLITVLTWIGCSVPAPLILYHILNNSHELLPDLTSHRPIKLNTQVLYDLEEGMKDTMKHYVTGEARQSWDKVQRRHRCCALAGYRDWYAVQQALNMTEHSVPKSCCPSQFDSIGRISYDCSVPFEQGCYPFAVASIQQTIDKVQTIAYICLFLAGGWSLIIVVTTIPWFWVTVTPKAKQFHRDMRWADDKYLTQTQNRRHTNDDKPELASKID